MKATWTLWPFLAPLLDQLHEPSEVCILVMSARGNVAQRQAIRSTWGKHVGPVYFFTGNDWCDIPPAYQDEAFVCELGVRDADFARAQEEYLSQEEGISYVLEQEKNVYPDLVLLDLMDSYGNLAAKVRAALFHALEFTHCAWFMKLDDDVIVQPENYKKMVARMQERAPSMRIVGNIMQGGAVHKKGKWAEREFTGRVYPPYPQGLGYFISRDVVEHMRESGSMKLYHNEDTMIGIWLAHMSHLRISLEHLPKFFCVTCGPSWCAQRKQPKNLHAAVLGHRYGAKELRDCYAKVVKERADLF